MGTPTLSSDPNAKLELAFDVGHSSIGWAVLRPVAADVRRLTSTPAKESSQSLVTSAATGIELLGCGVVTFGADDCLASKRRDYRRQRRHARSTRQRIARMEKLLAALNVIPKAELERLHSQAKGHSKQNPHERKGASAPWLLAARVLAARTEEERKKAELDWPELWDVLRWYAHNRGYDGNIRWSGGFRVEAFSETPQVSVSALTEQVDKAKQNEDDPDEDWKKLESAAKRMADYGFTSPTFAEMVAKYLLGPDRTLKPAQPGKPAEVEPTKASFTEADLHKLLFHCEPGFEHHPRHLSNYFKGLRAAFPRRIIKDIDGKPTLVGGTEWEVRYILRAHFGTLTGCDARFEQVVCGGIPEAETDWLALGELLPALYLSDDQKRQLKALRIPKDAFAGDKPGRKREKERLRFLRTAITRDKLVVENRYSGGLLFGQLVPRFDNRIITRCPISGDKVPVKQSPEFLRYRWAMQLANIQVAASAQEKLRKLTADDRAALHKLMQAKGALTEGELKKAVRALPGVARDNLDTMLMHPDAKDALIFDPVQKLLASDELAPFWATLPANLQARFRGKLRHAKAITLADLRTALPDPKAFDVELQRQLDAQNTRKAKKQPAFSRDQFLAQSFDARKALARLSGRAPYARPLLQQAYEQVLAGKDPREEGGCLFRSEEIRQRELHKKLEDQTNNHLVRHRLLILERLLKDLVNAPEFAAGQPERVAQVTIEVNRDLREFSGMTRKAIEMDLGSRLKNFKSVSDKLEKAFDSQTYNGKPVQVTAGLIRKARIAEDLGWQCPYTGQSFEPVHLVSRAVDKDHVIPRSQRPSDSLESLVVTFSEVNKMKGQRTAWQFIQEFGGKPVEGMPNLMIRTPKQFEEFVTKLESFKGHEDDKRRKKRRKDLLLLPKFEDKGFVPRDLTLTSQLVRLGAQVIKRFFAGGARVNNPREAPTDSTARGFVNPRSGPRITSLPGAVTGAVRKGWRVLGCLAQAAPQILEPTGEPKSKTDIRDLTHLHHALDACVLALAAHYFPKDGSLWEAMIVRAPNAAQKQLLHATGFYEFIAEDKPNLKDLPIELKQQIANRLAEKRVVQHIPADMSGMKVEENTRGVVKVENGRATLRQQKRNAEGKLEVKETEEVVGKLVGLHPEPKREAHPSPALRAPSPLAGRGEREESNDAAAGSPPSPFAQRGERDGVRGAAQGKLTPMRGVRVITDNFGVAILDHASNPDDRFVIIPWHKVWHRIEALKEKNGGQPARVLRIGTLIRVPNKSGRSDYRGTWMIRGAQLNQNAGMLVDLSNPDVITYRVSGRKDCKQNVSLKSLVEGGLEILKPSLCGVAQTAQAMAPG